MSIDLVEINACTYGRRCTREVGLWPKPYPIRRKLDRYSIGCSSPIPNQSAKAISSTNALLSPLSAPSFLQYLLAFYTRWSPVFASAAPQAELKTCIAASLLIGRKRRTSLPDRRDNPASCHLRKWSQRGGLAVCIGSQRPKPCANHSGWYRR